ncbi:AAA family ATPase [Nostoc sp. C110]|uniref:trifunctional serine/threonine-protein kinase/ATP-binding protein/sensor histidine kinase n=1 Tax=Nostoc sp. C110 TaxID=3349876 RepID=UPI00370DD324
MISTKLSIPGYQVNEQLYDSARTLIYRGFQETDSLPVIIKLLKNPYPSFSELVQFRNQYTITKNLNYPGIIQTYSLEAYQNGYILVMEDFGGISLKDYFVNDNAVSLKEFLKIAISLCDVLNILSRHRIIHKDIKPANILINPETKQVKLIDFSIASLLPRETQTLISPNVLEGTLAYISPEQTGRMNQGIDYRTDFYSLGVTFYELLTGELPFQSNDLMELVHCHIAKSAPLVDEIDPQIPSVLSEIVRKLMGKNASSRYQSILGLKFDLENCLTQLQKTGEVKSFPIAQRDVCDRFIISDKLYGRETEIATLIEAFERVSKGATEIMLVTGFSGIGKTAVINEVHKPIVRQHGYFIKGKFDQFQRNIPLSAFVQAFRDLIWQLLTLNNAQIQQWKNQILEAVGENGQVIIEVIPELSKIIGEQPPAPELSGTATRNRFNLSFQKFTQVFTIAEHPLVIFLDDLQWADSASLNLMQLLIADTGHLLLIGAYRDNEVNPAHPLILTLSEIQKTQAPIHTITLTPLSQGQLNQLVADTLKCTENVASPLSQSIYQKTQGNPFFTTQFIKVLHQEEFIKFDLDSGCWKYEITQVNQQAVTDDVVEFMVCQLRKLPESTQQLLQLAACIGNQFDLVTLAIVSEKSKTETAAILWKALQEGLILPTSANYSFHQDLFLENNGHITNNIDTQTVEDSLEEKTVTYKFLHDRIQQAASFLIPKEQKELTHLQIGQLILKNTSLAQQSENIFEIVGHLNYGIPLINQPSKRQELAKLNLKAGHKAKEAIAYGAALQYFNQGIQLLISDGWENAHDLTRDLYHAAAEVAFISNEFEQMESLIEVVIQRAKNFLDKVKVYEIKLQYYQVQGQMIKAIDIGCQTLRQLGIPLFESVTTSDIHQAIENTLSTLGERQIESLIELPLMTDPQALVALKIMISLTPSVHQAAPHLFPIIACEQVNLSLKYGNAALSAPGYADFGIVLNAVLNQLEKGYKFGQLALKIVEKFDAKSLKSMTSFKVAAFNQFNKLPVRDTINLLQESYTLGLEVGDSVHMIVSTFFRLFYTYLMSVEDLKSLLKQIKIFESSFATGESFLMRFSILKRTIEFITEYSHYSDLLIDKYWDEGKILPALLKENDEFTLHEFYLIKLIISYLFDDPLAAVSNGDKGERYLKGGAGMLSVSVFHYYDSLARLSVYSKAKSSEQAKLLLKVDENQKHLKVRAIIAPMNFQHKFDLVEAERHWVLGQRFEAIDLYDRAIAGAKKNEYIQQEALANELAAKFYLDWGKEKVAQAYMQEAYYCYARWGAKAKTDDLEKRYPELLQPILHQHQLSFNSLETIASIAHSSISLSGQTSIISSTNISDALDFMSILKAAQAISSSIELDEIIASLTKIILENSGAHKFALILSENGNLKVKAITFINHQNSFLTPIQTILKSQAVDTCEDIPRKIINYVKNTQQTIVIDNCQTEIAGLLGEYLLEFQPQSVFCTPIINQGHLVGILYLENKLVAGVFTSDRIKVIQMLSVQAAISLENARLYQESQEKAQQIQQSLQQQKTLFNVVNQIRESLDLDAIFGAVTQNLRSILNVSRVGIYQFHLGVNYEYGEFIAEDVLPQFPSGLAVKIQDYCFGKNYATLYKQGRFCAISDIETAEVLDCHRAILQQFNIRASLVVPIMQDDELWGLLCIHQCEYPHQWQPSEIEFAQQIAAQMGVALQQTDLLLETRQQATQLEETLQYLKETQLQLVQNEKMSALGNLVAGVAHEMNNPLGFISASLEQSKPVFVDIFKHLKLYQESLPNPKEEIIEHAEKIDLEYSLEDLPKMIDSMMIACDRLKNISTSLCTFSRADQDYKVPFHIHQGIDSTILILKHRLKANEQRPAIEVITNFDNLPQVECFPGQLNQVFMNIIANAIDALDESNTDRSFREIKANPNRIIITTLLKDKQIEVKIADNGQGMSESVKQKVFDHLFTTKGVGKGTGLGLAIAQSIVIEKHGGTLNVNSTPGVGTEFVITLPILA